MWSHMTKCWCGSSVVLMILVDIAKMSILKNIVGIRISEKMDEGYLINHQNIGGLYAINLLFKSEYIFYT